MLEPYGVGSRLRLRAIGLFNVGMGVAAACGGGDATDVVQVLGGDDSFSPEVLEIAAGDAVERKMEGDNPHNVFASDPLGGMV